MISAKTAAGVHTHTHTHTHTGNLTKIIKFNIEKKIGILYLH